MLALSLAAHDPERCAPGSWQRIGGGSPPRGRFSQPPRPPSDARGSAREGSREAFTEETTGQVLSCETGLIPRCRSRSVEEKVTSSHGVLACMGRTSRSRRPCARGEVLCAEPGRSRSEEHTSELQSPD